MIPKLSWARAFLASAALMRQISAAPSLTLNDICEASYVQDALPDNAEVGIEFNNTSVVVDLVTNYTGLDGNTYDFCDVNFTYSHAGRGDQVSLNYWLPDPSTFKNRYLSTGGAGFKSKFVKTFLLPFWFSHERR